MAVFFRPCMCILFAQLLGLSSFAAKLQGRNIMIFSDNTSAEAATRRGSCREFDQGCLIHTIWLKLAQLRCGVWVERVPTEDNIADHPSRYVALDLPFCETCSFVICLCPCREEYALLRKIGAKRLEPRLDSMFDNAQTWEALSIQGVFERATPGMSGE